MKRMMGLLVALVSLLGAATSYGFGVERFVEGVHYARAEKAEPQPGQVVEFFSFGCPHCAHLEPGLEKWLASKPANASFSRVPVTWSPAYAFLAQVYFALEAANLKPDAVQKVFDHIHKQNKSLTNEKEAAALLKKLGVDEAGFKAAWNRPDMQDKLMGAQEMLLRYRVAGVPTFLVAGQYVTSVSMAGSEAELFDVISFLLTK